MFVPKIPSESTFSSYHGTKPVEKVVKDLLLIQSPEFQGYSKSLLNPVSHVNDGQAGMIHWDTDWYQLLITLIALYACEFCFSLSLFFFFVYILCKTGCSERWQPYADVTYRAVLKFKARDVSGLTCISQWYLNLKPQLRWDSSRHSCTYVRRHAPL